MEPKILTQVDGGVARLLLNKTARLNALDEEMLSAIEQHFAAWEKDAQITVVVLGSTTPKAFCVGADIECLSRLNEASMYEWELQGNRVLDRVQSSPLVSVAVIPGHALGGGLTLAAACDFRIASDSATFGQPEIDLGWVPGWGGVARLARLVGVARATEMSMTGRRLSAPEAERIGLVTQIHPAGELDGAAARFTAELAGRSRAALRGIKALAAAAAQPRSPETHRYDAGLNSSLLNDPRGQAAIRRFLERKQS